jgi:hypothetical protein
MSLLLLWPLLAYCPVYNTQCRDYGHRGSAALTTRCLYPQKFALSSPTSSGQYSLLADQSHGDKDKNYWLIVPASDDDDECGAVGMLGRGNQSTRRKPAPVMLFVHHKSHMT